MSITMAKGDGVTVFTLTSDPQSLCPPICQIFKSLCYSPMCCSVPQHLRRVQTTSQSVLGALHIMVGLLNFGLGGLLVGTNGALWWKINKTGLPYWFGGMLILFGIMSILSGRYPSLCLVILNMIMNLAGVALAITATVLYSINLTKLGTWLLWREMCDEDYYSSQYNTPRPTLPQDNIMMEKCLEGRELLMTLHIMVGLFNIGLGAILCNIRAGIIDRSEIPYWFGGSLIFIGIMSILSEKCPSPCLVALNIIVNLVGFGLTMTAIVFYSWNLENVWRWWLEDLCDFNYYRYRFNTPKPAPHEDIMKEKCLEGKELIMMLARSMNVVLIVLSVLELCVIISSVVMGIKALCSRETRDNKSKDDPEHFKAQLEEVNSSPTS